MSFFKLIGCVVWLLEGVKVTQVSLKCFFDTFDILTVNNSLI